MFDTHCHLNFKRFKKTLGEVIVRAHEAGVSHMLIPGTDVKSSIKAVEIAQAHEGIFAAVGIHPHHAFKIMRNEVLEIEKLLGETKVVAIGEVGMDRHTYEETVYAEYQISPEFITIQQKLLTLQIDLALKHDKSLILHNREAKQDILQILREKWDEKLEKRTVFHCCEPDPELLTFAREHKMYIGVDGDVTYDKKKREFIRDVPLEMLVIETDSPYILPEPLLSQKAYPNEPAHVTYIAEAVSSLKKIPITTIIDQTTENGRILFQV
ncbi:TatD family hydrolase [Candidatus Woesebacteria bacterium]|nr:TatD family hydrolase [Candidatus Woesebacteria bacterium]